MLRLLMLSTWIAAALASLAPVRSSTVESAIALAGIDFAAAFITRLVFKDLESRYQLFVFIVVISVLEAARSSLGGGRSASLAFWITDASIVTIALLLAREISHHGYLESLSRSRQRTISKWWGR